MRPMAGALETLPGARRDTPKCRECEKWSARQMWCPLRVRPNDGRLAMCRYGIVLHRAKKLKGRREKRRGGAPLDTDVGDMVQYAASREKKD